jgi:hypothetical protein
MMFPRTVQNAPQMKNTVRTIALKQPRATIPFTDLMASNFKRALTRPAAHPRIGQHGSIIKPNTSSPLMESRGAPLVGYEEN